MVRETRLGVGEWIDTREGRARLSVGEIGEVRLEPSTRVGLLDAGERSHHLSLARGVMHAVIWAPPGQFLVDTPSAVAVDLGCSYTLEVADDGSGLLRVETGWVGFESRGLQSLVPAGAACRTRRGVGPGTPYFETAPEALRRALVEIDFGSDGREGAPPSSARSPRRVSATRSRCGTCCPVSTARIAGASSIGSPRSCRRRSRSRARASCAATRPMRDLWWDELGLGSADFWRDWTARWQRPEGRRLPARAAGSLARPTSSRGPAGAASRRTRLFTAAIVAGASGGRSAAAALSRACRGVFAPGMAQLTASNMSVHRRASWLIVEPAGTSGRSLSTASRPTS